MAFDISERSRARALLNAVAGRAELKGDTVAVLDAVILQKMLRADEVVVAYHALPDRPVDAYRDALIKLNPAASAIGDRIGSLLLAPAPVGKCVPEPTLPSDTPPPGATATEPPRCAISPGVCWLRCPAVPAAGCRSGRRCRWHWG